MGKKNRKYGKMENKNVKNEDKSKNSAMENTSPGPRMKIIDFE